MWTVEDPADPICQLVSREQPVGLYDLALAMDPLGLYWVEPRALLRQEAAYDPHPRATFFDPPVVRGNPGAHLFGSMPASVIPDQNPHPLACSLELLAAPCKEAGGYPAHGAAIHEAHPHLLKLRQVEPVAGDGLRIGVIFGNRLFDEAQRLARVAPTVESRSPQPTPPGLVQETHRPSFGIGRSHFHQPIAPPFFLSYRGSGEVIHRLARCHLTPRRRARVVRMVSPETRLCVSPSSKLACAAISKVHRLVSYPNSLGERWSISLKSSALSSSKASRVLLGREDLATRASTPLSLKSWMASRTVCGPQPRLAAILGAYSPLELAREAPGIGA